MDIRSRPYRIDDFHAVRKLLQTSYQLTGALHNWSLRRWDGWHYHRADLSQISTNCIFVWENEAGEIVAVLHPEYKGSAFIEIHPHYRQLEEEMLVQAEDCLLVIVGYQPERKLHFWVRESDTSRQKILEKHHYDGLPHFAYIRKRMMTRPVPELSLADGYKIRPMRFDDGDRAQMANLLNAAFGRSIHSAKEYANFQTAPCYRADLDMVVVAPDGTFAATAGVTIDDMNSYGEFEPVCTHPVHQRKGLARAVMTAGLHNLQHLGIKDAYVSAGDNPIANDLYEKMGFIHAEKIRLWQKIW